MAKKLYLGEGNNSNKVSKLYIGEQNTANKIVKAYIGIDGKSKLFYTSGYIWKKYNVITTYTYELSNPNYIQSEKSFRGKGPKYWFNDNSISNINNAAPLVPIVENGILTGLQNVNGGLWGSRSAPTIVNFYYNSNVFMKQFFMRVKEGATDYPDSSIVYVDLLSPDDQDSSNVWLEVVADRKRNYYRYMSLNKYPHHSQGSYITDVESDNPNAFPDNGYKDGYWYVKQNI